MVAFVLTENQVSVILSSGPQVIGSESEKFAPVVAMLKRGPNEDQSEQEFHDELETLIRKEAKAIENSFAVEQLSDSLKLVGGVVYYKEHFPVNQDLTTRLLDLIGQGFSPKYFVKFMENFMENPSNNSQSQLARFMVKGNVPITSDGCFIAYKAIRKDWTDIHSGKFDNSIGRIVEVPRNQVDEDHTQTCSYGLHVCSFGYLPSFAHADGHVVEVKVNPKDVVAVPPDYQETKMRVCKYEVVRENFSFYDQNPHCIVSKSAFYSDKRYLVEVANSSRQTPYVEKGFDDLEQAREFANKAEFYRVLVVDTDAEDVVEVTDEGGNKTGETEIVKTRTVIEALIKDEFRAEVDDWDHSEENSDIDNESDFENDESQAQESKSERDTELKEEVLEDYLFAARFFGSKKLMANETSIRGSFGGYEIDEEWIGFDEVSDVRDVLMAMKSTYPKCRAEVVADDGLEFILKVKNL